jgi:SAM-dependent methyltransferase
MVALFAAGVLLALEAGPRSRPGTRRRVREWGKALVSRIGPLRRRLLTSTDYEVGAALDDGAAGWSSRRAVRRQDRAWRAIVDDALAGNPRDDVAALWRALDSATGSTSILEVGSGHGHIAELVHHQRSDLRYAGIDISHAMCSFARDRHPAISLVVGDAVALPIATGSVDIVLDAATLMHVPDWRAALREDARAARHQLILHSVTVADVSTAVEMRKYAYGVQVYEAVLSRRELTDELDGVGFRVVERISSLEYDLLCHIGVSTASETWVCTRISE